MTLLLSNSDVEQLATMPECMSTLERSYVDLAAGRALSRTRSDCLSPAPGDHLHYGLMTQDGVIPSLGIAAVRINSDIVSMMTVGDHVRRTKVPSAPDARYVGLLLLFSTENGEPLAILPDGVLQRLRVGATSGLGIKYLARADARSIGLIGSGGQARAQLVAACAVRDITSIRCFSPNRERREAFCREMSDTLCIDVQPVESPELAMRGVDIALCATSSEGVVFRKEWLSPGLHVGSIRKPEIEMDALRQADRVVIHTRDIKPITELSIDLARDPLVANRRVIQSTDLDIRTFPVLADVIAGTAEGRRSATEITCFMNNLGTGFQFAATGALVYRKARELGVGRDLPTDWFTEDICP
ncbi:MAG: ocd2 [Hyphomicrobiales bacterium]|nr:ocd2 [Hyphomicrobiales bacterium]